MRDANHRHFATSSLKILGVVTVFIAVTVQALAQTAPTGQHLEQSRRAQADGAPSQGPVL